MDPRQSIHVHDMLSICCVHGGKLIASLSQSVDAPLASVYTPMQRNIHYLCALVKGLYI